MNNKEIYFESLLHSVNNCDLCKRMSNRKKVLSTLNGNLHSKVIFIAEAPGRLGADCTGIPLYGDKTGENFDMLISNIEWSRNSIFITNAILCNPQDDNGNNSTPIKEELINCSYYLTMLIELINPEVIITLGVKALESLKIIENHNYVLKDNVAQLLKWNKRYIFPLYHMGPRATIHRNLRQQRADFIKLSHEVDPIKGLKKVHKKNSSLLVNNDECFITEKVQQTKFIEMILLISKELVRFSFFKLTKLLYLCDYNYLQNYGSTISEQVYLRMQEGPWIPNLKDTVNRLDKKYIKILYEGKKPIIEGRHSALNEYRYFSLTEMEITYIKEICNSYKNTNDTFMKIAAYKTEPMKYIMKQEDDGRSMLRIPVMYKDKTVIDIDGVKDNT